MFEISKYKKSNVKISIRLPENMNETLKKIAKKENMSFNNVIVSCIQNSLDEMDMRGKTSRSPYHPSGGGG